MLPSLIPQEDGRVEGAHEAVQEARHQLHLEKQCTKVEDSGSELTIHFGDDETVKTDLMLVSVGRGPLVV